MLRKFFTWLRRKEPEPLVGATIYETLLNQLGDLDELTKRTFSPSKAKAVTITTATQSLGELRGFLVEASVFVSRQEYMPEKWKSRVIRLSKRTLDDYIADGDDLIHPLDWLAQHRHYIIKLLDAFLKLEHAEQDYYQRKCNFVIEDLLVLATASRDCLR